MKRGVGVICVVVILTIGFTHCYLHSNSAADNRILNVALKNDLTGVTIIQQLQSDFSAFGDSSLAWKLDLSNSRLLTIMNAPKADLYDVQMAQEWVVGLGENIDTDKYRTVIRDYVEGYSIYYLIGADSTVYLFVMDT